MKNALEDVPMSLIHIDAHKPPLYAQAMCNLGQSLNGHKLNSCKNEMNCYLYL